MLLQFTEESRHSTVELISANRGRTPLRRRFSQSCRIAQPMEEFRDAGFLLIRVNVFNADG